MDKEKDTGTEYRRWQLILWYNLRDAIDECILRQVEQAWTEAEETEARAENDYWWAVRLIARTPQYRARGTESSVAWSERVEVEAREENVAFTTLTQMLTVGGAICDPGPSDRGCWRSTPRFWNHGTHPSMSSHTLGYFERDYRARGTQ